MSKKLLTILIDNREQKPWQFRGYDTKNITLHTGDYSVEFLDIDYSKEIVIERKTLDDFVNCCATQRKRFVKELERSMSIPHFFIIIEGDWSQIERGFYHSQINPNSVIGSILSWQIKYGVQIILTGNRTRAKRLAKKVFESFVKNRTLKKKKKAGLKSKPNSHSEHSLQTL